MTSRGGRAKLFFIVITTLISLGFISSLVWTIVNQGQIISTQQSRITQQNKTIDHITDELIESKNNSQTLYDQIISMGETPEGSNPQSITGVPGRPGTDGRDGRDGLPGKDGIDGQDGIDGTDGLDGQPGKDGKDGAPGPQGPVGPQGPQGPAGPTCADGTTPTQTWVQTRDNPNDRQSQEWQFVTLCITPTTTP